MELIAIIGLIGATITLMSLAIVVDDNCASMSIEAILKYVYFGAGLMILCIAAISLAVFVLPLVEA